MKTQFDDAIGVVPPSTLDVDALVARGRRGTAYRRLGMSAAGVGGVAVLAAAVFAGVLGIPKPGYLAAASGQAASASAKPSPGAAEAPKPETAQEVEVRLTAALKAIVNENVPGAKATRDAPAMEPLRVYNFGGSDATSNTGNVPLGEFEGSAQLTDKAGKGLFFFSTGVVSPASGYQFDHSCATWPSQTGTEEPETSCEMGVGPHGASVMRVTLKGKWPGSPIERRVSILKADGTGVYLIVDNGSPKYDGAHPARPAPMLTFDQLVTLGTDPRLNLRR